MEKIMIKKELSLFKIIILLIYICVASISATIITPALDVIQSNFHLTASQLQWVISLFLLGYVVGQLIYGPLASRVGGLKALRLGLIINLIGIMLCLLSLIISSYALLLFGRLITALGAASGLSCTFILINDYLSDHKKKQVLGFCIVSFTLGIGLAILIGGFIAQYLDVIDCFWVLFIHGILMFLATYLFMPIKKQRQFLELSLLTGVTHFKS